MGWFRCFYLKINKLFSLQGREQHVMIFVKAFFTLPHTPPLLVIDRSLACVQVHTEIIQLEPPYVKKSWTKPFFGRQNMPFCYNF